MEQNKHEVQFIPVQILTSILSPFILTDTGNQAEMVLSAANDVRSKARDHRKEKLFSCLFVFRCPHKVCEDEVVLREQMILDVINSFPNLQFA